MAGKHHEVLAFITQLSKPLRGTQLDAINLMLTGLDNRSRSILRSYYGYLIQRFLMNAPKQALSRLIIEITDSSVVTQSRVDRLCTAYVRDPHPAISSILRNMRLHASPGVYFPPTGLFSAEYSQIPVKVSEKLGIGDLDSLIPAYTRVVEILQKGNPTSNANALAQLYPLAQASNSIFLPIEEYFYNFLANWDGTSSPTINILVKYLRFWPQIPTTNFQKLVLDPLAKAHNPQAILHDIVLLGGRGEPLVRALLDKVDFSSPSNYVSVLLFYMKTNLDPPPELLYQLVIDYPGLLFICREWASLIPQVKSALQGDPSFVATGRKINVDDFALANNPWLGDITITAFEEMADSPWPGKITEPVLEKYGIAYADFCNYLLDRLDSMGLYIDEYLT